MSTSSASADAASAHQGGILSLTGQQWLILLMVQLSNLVFNMTITLANLVLPQVRGTLSATQDEISWVITLNLVATAIATPMTPRATTRMVASAICAAEDRLGASTAGGYGPGPAPGRGM